MNQGSSPSPKRGSVFLGLAVAMLVVSGGLLAGYFLLDSRVSEAEAARIDRPQVAQDDIESAMTALLGSEVTVVAGERTISSALSWSDLGVAIDRDELRRAASRAEEGDIVGSLRAAGAMPLTVDRDAATRRLSELAAAEKLAPENARLDLENRKIHPERHGVVIDPLGSLPMLEAAARSGASQVELRTISTRPRVTVADLGIDDISQVLAKFETKFSTSDYSRNYNLKLAASKLNGYILQPGVEFSFNEVVGARTEKEGYKIAHVITAGEMVDGLAGGTCQISTTLHGAAFFAGIGVVNATPHSRPSTYVTMGLDATVVYPHVDLKLRNDYDFPVAIHFKVSRGHSIVEILGKERPFDEIAFERRMIEKLDFDTITREDDAMPVGASTIDQFGFHGYKVDRVRKFYKDGEAIKRDRWRIRYAPVTEYARLGINPDPNLAPPKPRKKEKRLKEAEDGHVPHDPIAGGFRATIAHDPMAGVPRAVAASSGRAALAFAGALIAVVSLAPLVHAGDQRSTRVEVRLDSLRGHVSGQIVALFDNPTAAPLHRVYVWLLPNRMARPPRALGDVNFYWIYPRKFSPGSMTLTAVRAGNPGREVAVAAASRRAEPHAAAGKGVLWSIDLPAPVAAGDQVRLIVEYEARIPERYGPLGCISGRCTLAGGFYPMVAALEPSGWDLSGPPMRSNMDVTVDLQHPASAILFEEVAGHLPGQGTKRPRSRRRLGPANACRGDADPSHSSARRADSRPAAKCPVRDSRGGPASLRVETPGRR